MFISPLYVPFLQPECHTVRRKARVCVCENSLNGLYNCSEPRHCPRRKEPLPHEVRVLSERKVKCILFFVHLVYNNKTKSIFYLKCFYMKTKVTYIRNVNFNCEDLPCRRSHLFCHVPSNRNKSKKYVPYAWNYNDLYFLIVIGLSFYMAEPKEHHL